MGEWQQADFGSDFLIPERNLTVNQCLPEQIAFNEISFWVREQGLVFGDGYINALSTRLFLLWKRIPDGKDCIVFKKKGYASVEYRYENTKM